MRFPFYFCSLLLTTSISGPLAAQAQTAEQPNPTVAAETPAAAAFQPTTLFKLGTGLTRGLTIGGYMGTALPVVAGVERQVAPAWSLYGNVSSGWRVGGRAAAPDSRMGGVLVTELGVDLGVRRYYHQDKRRAAGRATGPFVGNYVAVQGVSSFTPAYAPRLYHEVTALSGQWGLQRRLGGHGLLDAYAGAGLETRHLSMLQNRRMQLGLHLEAGIKLSLVR